MVAKKKKETQARSVAKPVLFIASSGESTGVVHQLQIALHRDYDARPWTAGTIGASTYPLESLENVLDQAAYAVFVFSNDDVVVSRGKRQTAVRDNVLLELGMFIGRLGRRKCFVMHPKENPKIPSDLAGFTTIPFDEEQYKRHAESTMTAVATEIMNAINSREPTGVALAGTAVPAAATVHTPAAEPGWPTVMSEAVADMLGLLARGSAGVSAEVDDEGAFRAWAKNVLYSTTTVLRLASPALPTDAYVAWLRPDNPGPQAKLGVYESPKLPAGYDAHHKFARGDGLAGGVWTSGQPGVHSVSTPDPRWRPRAGCENAAYVCVPVGGQDSAGGVLSLGSDRGFSPVPELSLIMKVFAGVLAVGVKG